MIINNKESIKGLFKFSDKVSYETGDLILNSLGNLFTCKLLNGLDNIKISSEDELTESNGFFPYLLDNIASFDDYLEESASGVFSNKLISMDTLVTILNYYDTGLVNNGIIGGYFNAISDTLVSSNIYKNTSLNINNCLWTLMMDPNINNGTFKVHKNLPEINSFVGKASENYTWSILRQYTYQEGNDLIRVLEIIDIENPKIIFRSGKLGLTETPQFKYIYVDSNDHLNRLNYALELTNSRLLEILYIKEKLIDCFRYKSVKYVYQEESNNYIVQSSNVDTDLIYTFIIQTIPTLTNIPIESFELKADLSLLKNNLDGITYKVNNDVLLNLNINSNNLIIGLTNNNYSIKSIYCKQFFK